ncbi:MAG: HAMP domain-containing sensor histidine kinase [Gallicola sp.]|nr:HAMP domain-containing sensor histidine kinase [Gallicola sp.]
MKDKISLRKTLRNHFVLFTFAIVFLVFLVLYVMNHTGESLVDEIDLLGGESDYQEFLKKGEEEISKAESYGGKVQIIDGEYSIVYPKGENKTYSTREIYDLSQGEYQERGQLYSGILTKLSGTDEDLYKLFILPKDRIHLSYRIDMDLNQDTSGIFLLFVTAAAVMATGYWIILKLSTRRIDRLVNAPLKDLREDMKKVKEENYSIRHNSYAIEEFDEMRDSFESMTERLKCLMEKTKKDEFLRYQLISELGHDIKNSITPIKGYASILLMEEFLENRYKIPVEKIVENCNDMEKMLQILMSFGKLSRVDYQLNLQLIDIADLFRNIIAEKYSSFEMKEMEQIIDIEEKEIIVLGDEMELKRAIVNLVENAATHNDKGGKVYMGIQEQGETAEIVIADNGEKIEDTIAQVIFEPFIRKKPIKDKMGHSGLGLSIVKRIVEKHKGELELVQPYKGYSKAFVIRIGKVKK